MEDQAVLDRIAQHYYGDKFFAVQKHVKGYVNDAIYEYVFSVSSDGERPWRVVVDDICYLGFETRLEAISFAAVKKIENLKLTTA